MIRESHVRSDGVADHAGLEITDARVAAVNGVPVLTAADAAAAAKAPAAAQPATSQVSAAGQPTAPPAPAPPSTAASPAKLTYIVAGDHSTVLLLKALNHTLHDMHPAVMITMVPVLSHAFELTSRVRLATPAHSAVRDQPPGRACHA